MPPVVIGLDRAVLYDETLLAFAERCVGIRSERFQIVALQRLEAAARRIEDLTFHVRGTIEPDIGYQFAEIASAVSGMNCSSATLAGSFTPWSPEARAAFWAMLDRLFPSGRRNNSRNKSRSVSQVAIVPGRYTARVPSGRLARRAAAPPWARSVRRAVRDLLRAA